MLHVVVHGHLNLLVVVSGPFSSLAALLSPEIGPVASLRVFGVSPPLQQIDPVSFNGLYLLIPTSILREVKGSEEYGSEAFQNGLARLVPTTYEVVAPSRSMPKNLFSPKAETPPVS